MEWPTMEPWHAVITGLILAPVVAALVYKSQAGTWDFTRAPRDPRLYLRWLASLMAAWATFYYVPLLLGPRSECGAALDLWGPWRYVWAAGVFTLLLAVYLAYKRTVGNVYWGMLGETPHSRL